MRGIWLFLVLVLGVFLTGCTFKVKEYPVIRDPDYSKLVVKGKEKVFVGKGEAAVYPDPTRGYIENRTYNVFIMVWLDPSFKDGKRGSPDFELPPKAIVEAVMPLGGHIVYAQGRIKTREYGWQLLGEINKKFLIDSRIYYGGNYGWYVVFHQGDFER